MARKRYEVRGMMEWHPEFRIGRGRLQVAFTGGHLCGGASTPASYETSDPVVQKVIESSMAYRSGKIRCVKGNGEPASRVVPPRRVMEFKDLDEASDFLQREKDIPVDNLMTFEQCAAEALTLGIELVVRNQQQSK